MKKINFSYHRTVKACSVAFLCNSFYIVILAAIVFACHSKHEVSSFNLLDNNTGVDLTLDWEHFEGIPIDSLVADVSFVRLETTNECLIGKINQVVFVDSLTFIVDWYIANGIFCFNNQGKFLRKISREGQGPGEFFGKNLHLSLTDDKKSLVVTCWGKLMYFDFDGNLIREVKTSPDRNVLEMEFIDSLYMATFDFMGNFELPDKPSLAINDLKLNVLASAFPSLYSDKFHYTPDHSLRKYNNKVLYYKPWSNTFYRVTKDSIIKAYQINIIGGGQLTVDKDLNDLVMEQQLKRTLYSQNCIELKDMAFFEVRRSVSPNIHMFYSFHTHKTYNCNMFFTNPMCLFYCFSPPMHTRYGDDTLVASANADFVMAAKRDLFQMCQTPNTKAQLDNLYNGLTEEHNPILFFYKMRTDL